MKLISIFGHFLTVNNRRYARCYEKIIIPLCTSLEFYTHLGANSAKSFQNDFCKCSRALNIMFLNTSYFWWMSSFFSLSSHLKENSCHFVIQSEVKQKPKPIATYTTRSHTFSRAPRPLHASATSFDWFVGQPVCVLCDRRTSFNLQRPLLKPKQLT